ncbi:acid protease [Mycena leptocephala]|nr:acid protease [Mycena leptocephala]
MLSFIFVFIILSSVNAGSIVQKPSKMLTLPMRCIQVNQKIHPELRHQQQLNRGERLLARAAGLEGPSDHQLRANLVRRQRDLWPAEKIGPVGWPNRGESAQNSECSTSDMVPDSSEVTPDGADKQFITTIPIGTPPREFNIILDSGSGFFWVESSEDCNSQGGGCGNHTFLGGDKSISFVNTLKPWTITYGSGFASGDLITDTVVLGGSLLNNLTFGLAHVISSEFSGSTIADGLMGLCKAVQTLKNRGFIDAAITSYRLLRAIDDINNGEVTFGWKGLDSGLDYTKLDSSTLVTLEAMNDDACFWLTPLGGVSVDGEMVALSGSRTALMDTGTTLLLVPSTDLDGIHAMIPGAKLARQGTYTVPCNTTASKSKSLDTDLG